MVQAAVRFFAGATTPAGYKNGLCNLYRPEDGWRAYLIKGAPGTGKSTLLRRVWEALQREGEEVEVFCCSADPDSLDGIRFPARKLCLLDATEPHLVEPTYWGACEQLVPLSACLDERVLYENRTDAIAAVKESRQHHLRCRRLLSTAAATLSENQRLQFETLNTEKLQKEAARIAAKEFDPTEGEGQEERRWLSAVTPQGALPLFETVQALCPRIYTLIDEHGAAASILLNELKKRAVAAGHTVTVCACPLSPEHRTEHLLIPALGVAFITANSAHTVDFPTFRRLHLSRFGDVELLKEKRARLSFNRHAAEELLDAAAVALTQAREAHRQLESLCGRAMDWDRASAMGETLIQRLLSF